MPDDGTWYLFARWGELTGGADYGHMEYWTKRGDRTWNPMPLIV